MTGTMHFVYYTWITPERVMGQMAGKTIGPAKMRLTGTEICECQVQFGFRAFAHIQSVFHKIPQMSRFVFFSGISVSEMFWIFFRKVTRGC